MHVCDTPMHCCDAVASFSCMWAYTVGRLEGARRLLLDSLSSGVGYYDLGLSAVTSLMLSSHFVSQ
jgi:hypothetical protein